MNHPKSPKRRWSLLQFRIWHVLAIIALIAIPIGIYTESERRIARQEEAITIVENFGNSVITEPTGYAWLPERYRKRVIAISSSSEYAFGLEDTSEAFSVNPTETTQYERFANDNTLRIVVVDRPSAKEFFIAINQFHNLRELDFSGAKLRDVHVAMFNRKWPLRQLNLSGCKLTDKGFQILTCYDELGALDLSWSAFDDAQLRHLQSLPSLTKLDLQGTNVNDAHLAHIGRIKSLRKLNLETTEVRGHGLAALSELTNLHTLRLSSPAFPNDVNNPATIVRECNAAALPELPSLRDLAISGFSFEYPATLDEQSFKAIGKLPSLDSLDLLRVDFDDDSLRHLSKLSLQHVIVDENQITIRGLQNIANVDSIEHLTLGEPSTISPDELATFITQAANLKSLLVTGMPRSDALINAICDAPKLTSVALIDTDLSPEDVDRINANPYREAIDKTGRRAYDLGC